jgi:hypothetical protein
MPCYGVDTIPIDRMSEALRGLDIDLMDLGPDELDAYARERSPQLRMLVEMYLDMAVCFFKVMRAVAATTLILEQEAGARLPPERRVDRAYLVEFLPLYDRASERAFRHLRQLLMTTFENAPELQAALVAQMAASETVAEMQYFSTVRTADSPAQAQEHGKAGKEIVDSVKGFLKEYLNKFVKDKNVVHKLAKRVLHVSITKAGIEQSLHVVNEVLGMVFPRLA